MNRPLSLALALTFALTGCASVPAPTPDEIVAMAKAGQPASAIVAAIDAGGGVYPLGAAGLLALARAGVPEPVLEHLLATRIELERQRAFWYAVTTNPWPTTRHGVMPLLPPLAPVVAALPAPLAVAASAPAGADASAPTETSVAVATLAESSEGAEPVAAPPAPIAAPGSGPAATPTEPETAPAQRLAAATTAPAVPAEPPSAVPVEPAATTPETLAAATGVVVAPELPVTLPAPGPAHAGSAPSDSAGVAPAGIEPAAIATDAPPR